MTRRTYSDAFKREALAPVQSGQTVEAVADQLGIPNGTLWHWVRGTGHPPPGW